MFSKQKKKLKLYNHQFRFKMYVTLLLYIASEIFAFDMFHKLYCYLPCAVCMSKSSENKIYL